MKKFDVTRFCNDILYKRGRRSQKSISEELGLNRSTLSLIEHGKQIPTLDVYTKICDYYSLNSSDYFLECEDNKPLVFMMGGLSDVDLEELKSMLERIRIREKYDYLSRSIQGESD